MHWADVIALNLSRRGTKHIVSTGITPSGEFHIGHLREILTGEMIDKLQLHYNRSRQAAITSELIEIISGAESL